MKVITIGRSTENNDIVVNDEKVSRNHLQMVMDDNGNYSVVDLESTNGTYVNGQRISGEVRLRPGDEVRIGQTVLPWQNYFATSSQPPIVNHPMPPQSPKPNPNRTWIYIVIGAALLLLIGGGVAWKIYHDKQNEKIEQEEKDKEEKERQLEQEANDARVEAARLSVEAARLSEEAEAAARRAAESKSKEDQEKADIAARKAEEAKQIALQKETEWQNMKAELDAARAAQQEAEAQSVMANQAKEEAEQESQQAQEEARKAKEALEYAETETRLTKEFYGLISKIKPKEGLLGADYYQKICDELKWTPRKGEDNKEFIIRRFDNGDNAQKQRIVSAVRKVLGQQVKDEIKAETEVDTIGEQEGQPNPKSNDTIKQ